MSLVPRRRSVSFAVTLLLLLVLGSFAVPFVRSASAQATSTGDTRALVDGQAVSQRLLTALIEVSEPPYGTPGTQYLEHVKSLSSPPFTSSGIPIVVYFGADYCPYCAVETWSLVVALTRFGNFTNLEYMTSAFDDGDYSTLTFDHSGYQSNYVVFEPYELYDRADNRLMTLPPNYSAVFQNQGVSSLPSLDFANEYYIAGAFVIPAVLGTMNQSQIVASIQNGSTPGGEIKQAANVYTALICETTDNEPASVCGQDSITALTANLTRHIASTTEYTSPSTTVSSNSTSGQTQSALQNVAGQSASTGYVANGGALSQGTTTEATLGQSTSSSLSSSNSSNAGFVYALLAAVVLIVVVGLSRVATRRRLSPGNEPQPGSPS